MRSPVCNPWLIQARRVLLLACMVVPLGAQAWWNEAYKHRARITLNTTAGGVELKEPLAGVVVPIRLHPGNFDFLLAKPDGSDLRLVAADDKTPLKFSVERFDGTAELAVVWVQLPAVVPGSDKNVVYAYTGNATAAAEPAAVVVDAGSLAVFRFAEKTGPAVDATGKLQSSTALVSETNGLIGASARLTGTALEWPASDAVRAAAGTPYSVSLWAKPESAAGTLFAQGPVSLSLIGGNAGGNAGGKAQLRVGGLVITGGDLPTGTWAQLGFSVGAGKATLTVNGVTAAQGDLPANIGGIEGPLRVGAGFTGWIDELQIANQVRTAEWLKFARAAQGADAKLVAAVAENFGAASTQAPGEAGYMGILVKNLTVDAWVVIGILGVMFVIACWVMVVKSVMVGRVDKGNQNFLERFRAERDVMAAEGPKAHPASSLARLYEAGVHELRKRDVGAAPAGSGRQAVSAGLSGASIDAVKAAVDAKLVRETHTLNDHMVLLTIAISGGPFLGLLGTVVGVMITFAAIAAAGDVNVNAIAPGIAAALLATVAGLAVAIPALFGYNYLAARIKNISADMQIFVDEFVTRVAEVHGAR
jgi:biopolymer transport protein ExbB